MATEYIKVAKVLPSEEGEEEKKKKQMKKLSDCAKIIPQIGNFALRSVVCWQNYYHSVLGIPEELMLETCK